MRLQLLQAQNIVVDACLLVLWCHTSTPTQANTSMLLHCCDESIDACLIVLAARSCSITLAVSKLHHKGVDACLQACGADSTAAAANHRLHMTCQLLLLLHHEVVEAGLAVVR